VAVVANIIAEFNPKGVNDATKSFEKLGKLVGGVFATRAVFNFAKDTLKAAEAASTSEARIKQIATSMGLFGNQTDAVTKRLVKLADATARNTGIDQNAIKATQAKLLTFGELAKSATVVGGSFDRATQAAVDLAAAGFGSVEQNAIQLGKALQDPTKGITALARSGVTFTDSQKQMIRSMVEANDVLGAQNLVLKAIEQQVGGTAVATANDTDKMKVAFTQLKEQIGAQLVPAFAMALEAFIPLVEAFTALPGPIKQIVVVGGLAALMFKSLSVSLQGVGIAAKTANLSLGAVGIALTAAVTIYSVYSKGKAKAKEITDSFVGALQAEKNGQRDAMMAEIARRIVESKALKVREQVGISEREIADAINGKTVPALESLRESYKEATKFGANVYYANKQMTDQFGVSAPRVKNFLDEIDDLAGGMATARDEVNTLTSVTDSLTTSTEDAGSAAKAAAPKIRTFSDAAHTAAMETKQAAKWTAELQRLLKKLDDEAATLDIEQAFVDIRESAFEAFIAAVNGTEDAAQAQRDYQMDLVTTKKRVAEYLTEVLKLPDEQVTKMLARLDEGNIAAIESRIAWLTRGRTISINGQLVGSTLRNAMEDRGNAPRPGGWDGNPATPWPMADGGIVMPRPGGTPAILGEAGRPEAVIPLDRAGGMMGGSTIVNIYPKTMPTLRELTDLVNEARRRGLAI
jgi:hypothetical protein